VRYLIGSRAAAHHGLLARRSADVDVVVDEAEASTLASRFRPIHREHWSAEKRVFDAGGAIFECIVASPGSAFAELAATDVSTTTVIAPLGAVRVASPSALASIKRAHAHFVPGFHKTIADLESFAEEGATPNAALVARLRADVERRAGPSGVHRRTLCSRSARHAWVHAALGTCAMPLDHAHPGRVTDPDRLSADHLRGEAMVVAVEDILFPRLGARAPHARLETHAYEEAVVHLCTRGPGLDVRFALAAFAHDVLRARPSSFASRALRALAGAPVHRSPADGSWAETEDARFAARLLARGPR